MKHGPLCKHLKLQDNLAYDFSVHEIVIKFLHTHIQRNGVLRSDFETQMAAISKTSENVSKTAQQAHTKISKS